MSLHGILLIDLLGVILLVAILNLVRTSRLHAGYGAVWLLATAALMLVVSVRPLLHAVTRMVGAVFPASALSLLAFVFIFAVLILYSVRLSALSSRQTEIVQTLALRELLEREGPGEPTEAVAGARPAGPGDPDGEASGK